MRTQVPANIRRDFDASIDDIATAFAACEAGVQDEAARKLIAEYLFVAAATLFEGFVSDLFVAYINRDATNFKAHLLGQLSIQGGDSPSRRAVPLVSTSIPHLSVAKIRDILDPKDRNVTFATTDAMKEAAGTWLVPADEAKFTGTPPDLLAVIDFIKAIRNYLAHRSRSARDKMRSTLAAPDLPPPLQRGTNSVNDVGGYLRTPSAACRFEESLAQIRRLAVQLCP